MVATMLAAVKPASRYERAVRYTTILSKSCKSGTRRIWDPNDLRRLSIDGGYLSGDCHEPPSSPFWIAAQARRATLGTCGCRASGHTRWKPLTRQRIGESWVFEAPARIQMMNILLRGFEALRLSGS